MGASASSPLASMRFARFVVFLRIAFAGHGGKQSWDVAGNCNVQTGQKIKDGAHVLISKLLPRIHVKTLLDVFSVTVYGVRSCK